MVLCEYNTPNNNSLSRGNFITDKNGKPEKLSFIEQNNRPKADLLMGGLIALSSDSSNFTDKSKSIGQGYVMCKKPFYITMDNRVFSNSETDVAEKINELEKQGYDFKCNFLKIFSIWSLPKTSYNPPFKKIATK